MEQWNLEGAVLGYAQPKALCILMHGYGSHGNNLYPVARALAQNNQDIAYWCPDAPEVCAEYPNGRQWFSLQKVDWSSEAAAITYLWEDLQKAALALKNRLKAVPSDLPLFLGGFSQGAALAYHMGLFTLSSVGVLGFSGFYMLSQEPTYKPALLWCHGTYDEVVPYAWMNEGVDSCKKYDLSIETHSYPEGHSIDSSSIVIAQKFMQKHISLMP